MGEALVGDVAEQGEWEMQDVKKGTQQQGYGRYVDGHIDRYEDDYIDRFYVDGYVDCRQITINKS